MPAVAPDLSQAVKGYALSQAESDRRIDCSGGDLPPAALPQPQG
jgi:hypothetical protein